MQCKSSSSSGSEDNSTLLSRKKTALIASRKQRGGEDDLTFLLRKKAASIARAKQTASESDDDAPLLNRLVVGGLLAAKNSQDAKELLKQKFQAAHSGGHIRCINSRCVYTLSIALQSVLFHADAGKITFTSPASSVAPFVLRDLRNLSVVGM